MLKSAVIFAVVLAVANSQALDDLIKDVFKKDNTAEQPNLSPSAGGGSNLSPTAGGGSNAACTCVPYYQCNNNTINNNGGGLIDIRINENSCASYLDICCSPPEVTEEKITPPPPVNKPKGCGYRNPDGIGFRITGDADGESQYGEFPWMVAVLREETVEGNPNKLNVYQCGGALIHPQVVLTAAHCVSGKDKRFKIRAGEWDTQTKNELFAHQDRDVKSVVVHPQYYAGALFNDVALLFLEEAVTLAENIDVVCMPPQDFVVEKTRCFASGWGKDVFGKEGKYQVILKKIELPVMDRPTCQENLRQTRLGKFFELHRSFICAGGEPGRDTCKGDGGSPLVCPINGHTNRYFQAGIVAWGIGCGETGVPGVYVNIPLFRSWIDEQMTYNNLDMSLYSY